VKKKGLLAFRDGKWTVATSERFIGRGRDNDSEFDTLVTLRRTDDRSAALVITELYQALMQKVFLTVIFIRKLRTFTDYSQGLENFLADGIRCLYLRVKGDGLIIF
jgi:hypothetical protein